MQTTTNNIDVEVALWFKRLCETNNKTFIPLFFDKHRFLVLKGGGGSGKSIFAGRKIIERAVSEAGHRFLVCRKVGTTIRESCFNQIIGQLSELRLEVGYKINRSDMRIEFSNGSQILFSGLDDVDKLKSIYKITGIWIEEASELKESDLNQLNIRLRGNTEYYKQIIITFNPISITHWLKRRFFDNPSPKVLTHESTYKDNRFLDRESIEELEAFKDIDEYYYQVYALGLWGVTGKSVFDAKLLTSRLIEDIPPQEIGYFNIDFSGDIISGYAFTRDNNGFVRIYKTPEKRTPYVIGADTAGDGSDYFVAQVLDNTTGEQVCTMRHQTDEDLFAKQIFALGKYYNTALIAVETNYSTYVQRELERQKYPKLYIRETFDNYTHKPKKAYGFDTNTKTRPVIIAELVRAFRDFPEMVVDATTIEEMLTFVRDESFRPEAEAGAHDDCVMSLAIANFIRPHQSYLKETSPDSEVKWSKSQWEDYNRASPEEKKYLLTKWGKPQRREEQ